MAGGCVSAKYDDSKKNWSLTIYFLSEAVYIPY